MHSQKISVCSALIGLLSMSAFLPKSIGSIVNIPRGENMELLILHNNDMHARFEQTSQISSTCSKADEAQNKCYGGFARVSTLVKEARQKAADGSGPPVLYLNAGDTYTGTVWFTLYKWKIAADFINMLRPDAVSLGNHEFDEGVQGLSPFIRNLSCPVLCTNINLDEEPEMKKEQNLKNSVVIDVRGRKIGIIGYLTPETKYLVSPNKVEYIDEVEAIQKEVDILKKQGVNFFIALGHSGFETDQRIAKEVEDIDLVIGGHSNTFLWNGETPDIEFPVGPYPTLVYRRSGKNVPVVQAYAYTKYLGQLHLTIDPFGDIKEVYGQPILLDNSVKRDPEVLQLLNKYRPTVVDYVDSVVGTTKVLLDGATDSCRVRECNMGNLITDAMIFVYAETYPAEEGWWSSAPIAMIQGGGIRASINEGNISRADLLAALPFENEIVTVNVTGVILKEALEWSVQNYSEVTGAFLQVSGLHVAYNLSRPAGKRLLYANARCGNCLVPEYKPISDNQVYKIIMPDFLMNGGDRYVMLQSKAQLVEKLGRTDMNLLEDYIRKKSPIYPEVQERTLLHGKASATALKSNLLLLLITSLWYYVTHI